MCNLYSQTKSQDAMRHVFDDMVEEGEAFEDVVGNLPPMAGIFPDYPAPIIRPRVAGGAVQGWQLTSARWGMPTPQVFLEGKRTDPGVTNIRNVASPHWRRWLGVEHRCLVPFDRFAEPAGGTNVWFAPRNGDPAFLAGLHVRGWTSIRKLRDGETTDDLFAFLTCPPNREVAAVHPKAMPVILTRPEDWCRWLTAPVEEALLLQRPLPDGELEIVLEGAREDVA